MLGAVPGVPGQWHQFALELGAGGTLITDLALNVDVGEPTEAEIGFTLALEHQGNGYGTESVRGLLGYAFETLGLRRIIAVTDALNRPAAAPLDRVGMRREAHFLESVLFKGGLERRVPVRDPPPRVGCEGCDRHRGRRGRSFHHLDHHIW